MRTWREVRKFAWHRDGSGSSVLLFATK